MLFSPEGDVLGSAYREYDLIFTPEGVEQVAGLWWSETAAAAREAGPAAARNF